MRKAIITILSIAVATIASQADAKGKKGTVTTQPFVFTKHYDKSCPYLMNKTGSTTKPVSSGSSQKTGRK